MGLIILHAGMAKAGSTSIQHWLADNLTWLRESGVHPVRVDQDSPAAPIDLLPATQANAKSKLVEGLWRPTSRAAAAKQIFEKLDAYASRNGTAVVSNEGYQVLFWDSDSSVLAELDKLADAHTVRVAYYVRPQHTSLEASWRQWGFRHPDPPSKYLHRQVPRLRYLQTLDKVREGAPRVSFEMRPFRTDLLEGGDVVVDFAKVFLGIDSIPNAATDAGWSNRGFPLELSVVLRDAAPGLFWSSTPGKAIHDNRTLERLRSIAMTWEIPESREAIESRLILQRYSYRTFEPENHELIRALGWKTQYFVPPVQDPVGNEPAQSELGELDDLWKSNASEAQRQLLFCALHELVSRSAAAGHGPPPESPSAPNDDSVDAGPG